MVSIFDSFCHNSPGISLLYNIISLYEKQQEQDNGYLTVLKEDVKQDDADFVRHTDADIQ